MINLAIIEDNKEYRTALSKMLQRNTEVSVMHEMGDCTEMIPYFEVDLPDVVIMDIDLPEISGIEGVWQLKQKWPELKVLMLTVFEEAEKIFGAIKAGANGYLLKKDPPQKILDAIKELYDGKASMNGLIAKKVLEYFQQKPTVSVEEKYHLTKREKEILQWLMEGLSYKEIAAQCFISWETMNSHIKNIYQKLNVHSRAQLSARFRNQ